jgi:hypothetical protein
MLIGMACLMRHTNQHVGTVPMSEPDVQQTTSAKIIYIESSEMIFGSSITLSVWFELKV